MNALQVFSKDYCKELEATIPNYKGVWCHDRYHLTVKDIVEMTQDDFTSTIFCGGDTDPVQKVKQYIANH